jgi:hypothetical protein
MGFVMFGNTEASLRPYIFVNLLTTRAVQELPGCMLKEKYFAW